METASVSPQYIAKRFRSEYACVIDGVINLTFAVVNLEAKYVRADLIAIELNERLDEFRRFVERFIRLQQIRLTIATKLIVL